MKKVRESLNTILLSLFELIVGILLLISPVSFTTGIITTAGIVLMIVGVSTLIQYFRTPPAKAAAGQLMFKALVCLLIGVFSAFKSDWIIATFPLLTMLYGIVILLTGISKVQWSVDMLRQKRKRWWLAAIGAVISILFAVVIFMNPFSSTAVLWMFTGISLIVEAVMDIVILIASAILNKGEAV
ncbi:MAG: DUF308 domain-containing protein [Clostridia bacterium]|nr:DUF308 domain-containing protein [Clostridia bacterium]